VNAEIIKQGYGFAYTRFPFKYLEEFRKLERQAREAKRGLWGER
jgi:endonuclease YncB( thermonuclease family)